ncbi:MAG TPA: hypothetical protein VGU71_21245 [Candidatus Dormibacteraeota bacterium]|nr:hypothetical protein [Candidatus Dormibacteraeota bacterium]
MDTTPYEEALRRFHAALASAPSSGFVRSATYRIGDGYSDWYLVESSAALDWLNAAAISGARTPAHDAAARMAVDGVGKLLSLVSGDLPSGAHDFEARFAKPAGVSYTDLYARLQPWTSLPAVSLWRRMMVLGPPPEFCLVAPSALALPAEMQPEVLRRDPI